MADLKCFWCSLVVLVPDCLALSPLDDAVCRRRRKGCRSRDDMVVARWYCGSFQGTFLSLLNCRAQYSSCFIQSQFAAIHVIQTLSANFLTNSRTSTSQRLETYESLRRERVTAILSSLRIHLLMYIAARFRLSSSWTQGSNPRKTQGS